MVTSVSVQTLQRLPIYLNLLKSDSMQSAAYLSSKAIAEALGLHEIQVRKDLASVSSGGKPKVGFCRITLIRDLENYLGYNDSNDAILVGSGKLGKALLTYDGFKEYGLNIVAAFDNDDSLAGQKEGNVPILPLTKLSDICDRMKIRIGIITVPTTAAQSICDLMVASGILAVWNFAPTHLDVPEHILVKNENMAASLAVLSRHLMEKFTD